MSRISIRIRPCRVVPFRPFVERLEDRLPPGDAVLAGLFAHSWLEPRLPRLSEEAPAPSSSGLPSAHTFALGSEDAWPAPAVAAVVVANDGAAEPSRPDSIWGPALADGTEPFAQDGLRPQPLLALWAHHEATAQPELLAAVLATTTLPPGGASQPLTVTPSSYLTPTALDLERFQAQLVDPRSSQPGTGRGQCPMGLPPGTTCLAGQDKNGAYYLIAIPQNWNGTLVLYAHGGPSLAPPQPLTAGGLAYNAVLLPRGIAMAASSYRAGGYHVTQDAEDMENLRQLFVGQVGKPTRTIIFGISYGGPVGAKVVELYGVDPKGNRNYDGAVLGAGVLAGYRRYTYMRFDLRVIYQHYCQNHPYPHEPQYPLWQGLPPGAQMPGAELTRRVNECTGVQLPPGERTEEQQRNLTNILSVTTVPEIDLINQLGAGTTALQALTRDQLNGRNAFPNRDVYYTGSDDDEALNQGITHRGYRYYSDQMAAAHLTADSQATGMIEIPVVTSHAIGDFRVFVENESAYREYVTAAGREHLLFQTYVNRVAHTTGSNPETAAVFDVLFNWIDSGMRPTQEDVVAGCAAFQMIFGGTCQIVPDYQPAPLETRIHPREP